MDTPRPCGCKGCRVCLICEKTHGLQSKDFKIDKTNSFVYCPHCDKAWSGWNMSQVMQEHPNHKGDSLDYPGIFIDLDFLSIEEEDALMEGIDSMPWDLSQSGRRKQNFGPKCNFKKNKLRLGDFKGFPAFTKFVQEKFAEIPLLRGFQTIEQCSLEYDPDRGASIDPHVDDCWIWGERIVTVNLLGDSVLTMTYNDKPERYNLPQVETYPRVLNDDQKLNSSGVCYKIKLMESGRNYPIVRIPMPRRSLLVVYNSPRYDWEHQVLREDIKDRRVCLAYREFTPPYLPHGCKNEEAASVFLKATNFFNHVTTN